MGYMWLSMIVAFSKKELKKLVDLSIKNGWKIEGETRIEKHQLDGENGKFIDVYFQKISKREV